MNIIENCFSTKTETIVVAGNLNASQIWNYNFLKSASVNLITLSESKKFEARTLRSRRIYKLTANNVNMNSQRPQLFIVSESSKSSVNRTLRWLRDSLWWNYEGLFIFANEDPDDECKNTYHFLQTAWSFNILSAVFICYDHQRGISLYTFNPYSNFSPRSWITTHIYKGNDGHPWTLFKYLYNITGTFNVQNSLINCIQIRYKNMSEFESFKYPIKRNINPSLPLISLR